MAASDALRPLRTKRQRPSSAEMAPESHPRRHGSPCTRSSPYVLSSRLPMIASPHLVQFYDDEAHLYSVLLDFFAPFLRADGDGALMGAVLARLRTLRHLGNCLVLQGYQQYGIDSGGIMAQVGAVYRRGERRMFLLDAGKILARLAPQSELHVNVFQDLTAELLSHVSVPLSPLSTGTRSAGQAKTPTYIYGEIVDILCARSQPHLAFELETQWNKFIDGKNILLLCGYQMDSFKDSSSGNVFSQICHSHTTVTPTESYSRLETQDEKDIAVAALQQRARAASEEHRRPKHWSTGDTKESAEQQIRFREQFVETMCHELRNPVSAIVGNVDILQMGLEVRRSVLRRFDQNGGTVTQADVIPLRAQLVDDFRSMEAITLCAEHMKALSDNVLSLSKLEDGKVILQSLPFDPKSAIIGVTKMFMVAARKKGIKLIHDLPPDDIRVLGDQCRFSQVIINLVSNAVKFTDTGSVTIQLRRLESQSPPPSPRSRSGHNSPIAGAPSLFEVAVCDTGCGLSQDERAILFRRFAQPISTNYGKYGGTGLGLYISKYIVELMGGELRVESELRAGSRFVFTFEAAEHEGLEARRSPQPLPREGTPSARLAAEVALFLPPALRYDHALIGSNDSSGSSSLGTSPLGSTRSGSTSTGQMECQAAQSKTRMPHILLIDDDPIALRTLARMLTLSYTSPISISTATNGFEGIGKLISASNNGSSASLVIMDLHMPYMGGIEATKRIRALSATDDRGSKSGHRNIMDAIIIGFSGDCKEETLAAAKDAGMDECLRKPVARKVLLDVIEKVAERREIPLFQELSRRVESNDWEL